MKRQTALVILIAGLIFSQFIIMNYNVNDGFEFHGMKIRIGSLLQLHFSRSDRTTLTTSVFGYILFGIFLIMNIKNKNARVSKLFEPTLIVCVLSIIFELRNIILDMNNNYVGQRLSIGIILFALCFKIFYSAYDENPQTNVSDEPK